MDLAARVLRQQRAVLSLVVATGRRHPRLAATLADARAAHRAHVTLLSRAVPPDAPPPGPARAVRVPGSARAGLRAVVAAETRLGQDGTRAALAARSGPFARVLASMAAASAQQAEALALATSSRVGRR